MLYLWAMVIAYHCKRYFTSLGWTFYGSSYCLLICAANKEKQLTWAQGYGLYKDKDFEEVIWTHECIVQLETHKRFCCRRGEPKPRHVVWVPDLNWYPDYCTSDTAVFDQASCMHHVILIVTPLNTQSKTPYQSSCLGGISFRGRTGICIEATLYTWVRFLCHLSTMLTQFNTSSQWPQDCERDQLVASSGRVNWHQQHTV